MQAFLDPNTRAKVHVLGSGKRMQATLLEVLGPELMPDFLGGANNFEAQRLKWQAKMDDLLERYRLSAP